jgi:adenylate kinase
VIIVFVGPPGAGKGTQAKEEAERSNALCISTGDELRKAIGAGSPLGQKARSYALSGKLVPDALIIELVRELLENRGSCDGVVFDGFPRTLAQAEALDRLLEGRGEAVGLVLHFDASPEAVMERLSGRRVCRRCGATFHVRHKPPQREGSCDRCGGELFQRDDDRPETVRERLRVYESQTAGLLDYYKARRLLARVDANQPIDDVRQAVRAALAHPGATEEQGGQRQS